MPRLTYTPDSIARALSRHKFTGLIKDWRSDGEGRYVVDLVRAGPFELRSHREAYVFVAGLASAGFAQEAQRQAKVEQ
jgi:hypothetical protein